jgi:hypothetical protein
MPTLRDWRHIIAHGVATALSVPDADYRFPVVHWATLKPADSVPFAVIRSGGNGLYIDTTTIGRLHTVCQVTGYLSIYLFAGDVGSEDAEDVLSDLVVRLAGDRLRSVRDDPLNLNRFQPPLGPITQPAPIEFASFTLWGCSSVVEFPINP